MNVSNVNPTGGEAHSHDLHIPLEQQDYIVRNSCTLNHPDDSDSIFLVHRQTGATSLCLIVVVQFISNIYMSNTCVSVDLQCNFLKSG